MSRSSVSGGLRTWIVFKVKAHICAESECAALQGKSGMDMYKDFEADRNQGNFDKLPELHAVLSGMKVNSFLTLSYGILHIGAWPSKVSPLVRARPGIKADESL